MSAHRSKSIIFYTVYITVSNVTIELKWYLATLVQCLFISLGIWKNNGNSMRKKVKNGQMRLQTIQQFHHYPLLGSI